MYNKVQDSGKKEVGSGKFNLNNKININNKMNDGLRMPPVGCRPCFYQKHS